MHIVVHQRGITRLVQLRDRGRIEAVMRAIEDEPAPPRGERDDDPPPAAAGDRAPLPTGTPARPDAYAVDLG